MQALQGRGKLIWDAHPRPGVGTAGAGGMSAWVSGGSRYSHIRQTCQRGCSRGCDYSSVWWDSKKKKKSTSPHTTDHRLCPTIMWLLRATGGIMQYSFIQSGCYFSALAGKRKWFFFSFWVNNKYISICIYLLYFKTSALLSKYGSSKVSEHRWKGLPLVFSRLLANRLCAGLTFIKKKTKKKILRASGNSRNYKC